MEKKEIQELIEQTVTSGKGTWVQSKKVEKYQVMDIDIGKVIGKNKFKQDASWLKIIRDKNNGELVTAYPIKL